MILSKILTSANVWPRRSVLSHLKNVDSKLIVRHGSGRRILRTRSLDRPLFRKLFVRYALVGAIPTLLIIAYSELFVGDAVLYDHDPELYQPKHWEYFKHPISRWLAKYCLEDPALSYYKDVYNIETAQKDFRQTRLIRQVFELQQLEQSGMVPMQELPSMSRALTDDITEYIDKNLKKVSD